MQDSARVDSLVQVLQSDATLLRVIGKLHLQDDPEFNGTQPSAVKAAVAWVAGLFGGDGPPRLREPRWSTVRRSTLALGQTVERAAGTYIVTVSILSKDPAKAAAIANAFGDDYLDDQRRTDVETTRAAADWMKSRLAVLGDEMLRTQGAVAEFKSVQCDRDGRRQVDRRPDAVQHLDQAVRRDGPERAGEGQARPHRARQRADHRRPVGRRRAQRRASSPTCARSTSTCRAAPPTSRRSTGRTTRRRRSCAPRPTSR